tara:strand:- start:167 stop:448 length:282 start_codon:yes stop_codon:yes gene_type:complete
MPTVMMAFSVMVRKPAMVFWVAKRVIHLSLMTALNALLMRVMKDSSKSLTRPMKRLVTMASNVLSMYALRWDALTLIRMLHAMMGMHAPMMRV